MTSKKYATAILGRAADLIDGPGKWTREMLARRQDGSACGYGNDLATCWCVTGAIFRATHDLGLEIGASTIDGARAKGISYELQTAHLYKGMALAIEAIEQRIRRDGYISVEGWNDAHCRKQADVVSALRELSGRKP